MKKIILLFITMAIIGFAFTSYAHAGLYYSKPEFRGRVIDAETKEPIEGAVVVVLYSKCFLIGNPGGPNPHIIKAKETLTDKNGEFYISSYFALTPLSEDSGTQFIFYKPGYKSIEKIKATDLPDDKYFGIEKDMIGKEGEIKNIDMFDNLETWEGILGIVELEKANYSKTMSVGHISDEFGPKELPLFYKAKEEDDIARGLLPKGGKMK
ncbi:MAG: carboxypeptidase-like regulatory domain-containing protein [Desulfobacterium sp.]|nr:carboxypeptidase-like regulatory domain-containing protein [Desulfobacterium sp.]